MPRLRGMPDELEQLAGPLARRLRRLAQPLLDRLGDLVADAPDRVERVHRALEDDADLAPAVAAQRVLGLGHEVDAHELDRLPSTIRGVATAGSGRATARSSSCRSPTRRRCPSASPWSSRKRHAVDRLDRPRSRSVKYVLQVLDHEQRRVRVGLLGERPLASAAGDPAALERRLGEGLALQHLPDRAVLVGDELLGLDVGRRPGLQRGRDRRLVIGGPVARVEDVVERVADEREGQDDEDDADRRRHDVPPRPEPGRARRPAPR